MSLHDELLNTANRLVSGTAPTEADIRRGISTAYYALFHRLIDAAATHLLPAHTPEQRAGLARVFEHSRMRDVCQRVLVLARQPNPNPMPGYARILGPLVPTELEQVAGDFRDLYLHRQEADYDRVPPINRVTLTEARNTVGRVSSALTNWTQLEARHPSIAPAFLVLLLTGEPKSR
jgi:hypothetical protein